MPEDEYTRVPVKFIEDLSQKIEQLQHSLRRKQRILNTVFFFKPKCPFRTEEIFSPKPFQVIARQQKVIRRQQRLLLSLGETPVELSRDPFEKLRCPGTDQWTTSSGGKGGEDGEGGEESTTGDSAMDEAWEEIEDEEEEERKGTEAEENSDSFVTISDASFTDSEVSRGSKIKQEETKEKVRENYCFQANPYFDSDQSSLEVKSGKKESLEVAKAKEIPQVDTRVMIGDPEDLVDDVMRESCLPDSNFPAMNCLPRPVRMFRRSMGRSGGLGGLSRSKSENNLRDLKEEKPSSLFGSSFKNLWRKKEEEVKVMEISSPMLNRRPMILKTGQESLGESLNFSSMTDLRRDQAPEQRAFFQRPIFSCFLGNKEREWTEERSMPNHKTMTRPRDVKRRQRRTQTLLHDSYQLNYSIC